MRCLKWCILFAPMWVFNSEAITLKDAIKKAFMYNAKWKAAVFENQANKQGSTTAKMAFAPSVSTSISAGTSYSKERSSTSGTKFPDQRTRSNSKQAGLTLQQKILDFSSFAQIKKARESATAGDYELKKTEQDIILEALSAYVGLWAARENVEIRKKNEANLAKDLEASRKRREVGMGVRQDVAANEAAYAEAVFYRIDAESKLATAVAEFEKTIGVKPDDYLEAPVLPKDIPDDQGKLLAEALRNNPYLKSSKYKESVAESDIDVERGTLMPSIGLQAKASRSLGGREKKGSMEPRDLDSQSSGFSVTAELSVPLLAFTNYSRIKQANMKAQSAQMSYRLTRQEVEKACYSYWMQFKAGKAQIEQADMAVKSAEIAVDGMRQCLTVGTKSTTDVLQQEQKLLQSRQSRIEAIKNHIITAFTLMSLMGRLSLNTIDRKS